MTIVLCGQSLLMILSHSPPGLKRTSGSHFSLEYSKILKAPFCVKLSNCFTHWSDRVRGTMIKDGKRGISARPAK
jgi:hypothetical protein